MDAGVANINLKLRASDRLRRVAEANDVFNAFRSKLISFPGSAKLSLAMAADGLVLALCAWVTVLLVSQVRTLNQTSEGLILFAGPLCSIAGLLLMGGYRAVVRYIGFEFVGRAAFAQLLTAGMLYSVLWNFGLSGVAAISAVLSGLCGFVGLVVLRRAMQMALRPGVGTLQAASQVLIYGAGGAGTQLASALSVTQQFRVAGFVDDKRSTQRRTILGMRVYAPDDLPGLKARGVFSMIILAMPSMSRARRRALLERLEPLAVQVMVMPALEDIVSGRKRVDDIREVQIEDLLARDTVAPMLEVLDRVIRNHSVLVTGAGGSIGSELSRQILQCGATRLVLLDASEYALYQIERELRNGGLVSPCQIIPVLGSVLDEGLLKSTLNTYEIETVYHAAAYKHVPLVESNVVSAARNNVLGTLYMAQTAIAAGVKHFVLVSTDKAVRPTSVMGASKRVCEMIVQALAEKNPGVRMSIVRFGNVLASSGSVIPLFLEQIRAGGPVTVTHPEVTRYFMTIREAAQLVLQASAMGAHGEVFVLDMGQPVRIVDLAERMIHLSGLRACKPDSADGDIKIEYTGLRPGEKLYEELLIGDNPAATTHPRIFKAQEEFVSWPEFKVWLTKFSAELDCQNAATVQRTIVQIVSGHRREYVPSQNEVAAQVRVH